MKKLTNWLWAFAGGMVTGWLNSYFYDSTKDIPVLKYLTGALKWLYDAVIIAFTFKVAVWVILVSIAAIMGILYLIAKLKDSMPLAPDFTKYKEDVLKKWKWKWDWKFNGKHWQITNLRPHCPVDGVSLVSNGDFFRTSYYCPKCDTQFNDYREPVEYPADAEALIFNKIDNNNYPKS